ncbi:hypothetical protein QQ045_013018 [Rhodiola kirilowii]
MLLQLLLKASQDKKFVCEEADRALKSMVVSMNPLPLLHKLQKYVNHTSLWIRAKASVSFSNCISKMGLDGAKEFGLVSLFQTALKLLNAQYKCYWRAINPDTKVAVAFGPIAAKKYGTNISLWLFQKKHLPLAKPPRQRRHIQRPFIECCIVE